MRCLGNSLVVIQGKKQSERNGILLPDTAQEDCPMAEVVAVGPDVTTIEPGDHVLIPMNVFVRIMRTQAFDMQINGKPAIVLREDEIQVMWEKGKELDE